jgi:phospholipid/cholesterol/gamma-HCH transport system substrate-binding protein
VGAIAERRDDLTNLVSNANATARAIGDENAALARALGLLPTTLRKANTTFVNLRAALGDLDGLVNESKPATKDLAPFLRALRPLVADAEPTIRDLRFLIKKEGPGNDLIDLTRKQPKLAREASIAFPRSIRALQKAQPVIDYIRPYTPDFAGWITKFGQGADNYDAHGHFARIQPMFNPFSLTSSPLLGQVLTPVQDATRLQGLETAQSFRCPGGATQPPPDGSAPWRDTDGSTQCDPSTVPPGP